MPTLPTTGQPTQCQCFQDWSWRDGLKQNFIVFCPLHAAAPDLLAALQRAADTFRDFEAANRALRRDTMADAAEIAARDARAAIRAATGG